MGVVYLAEHPGIGRRAAVKVLLPEASTDNAEIVKRFFNEARAATAIRHPGIVEVFDFGTLPDGARVHGDGAARGREPGGAAARADVLPVERRARLRAQVAGALAAAHARRHRPPRPQARQRVPGARLPRSPSGERVKILDFGIAKLGWTRRARRRVRTRTGAVMGTPAYMSPEQCRGTRTSTRAPTSTALGCILFEMVCGRPPFVSEGVGEMVHLHISATPPAPRSIEPERPRGSGTADPALPGQGTGRAVADHGRAAGGADRTSNARPRGRPRRHVRPRRWRRSLRRCRRRSRRPRRRSTCAPTWYAAEAGGGWRPCWRWARWRPASACGRRAAA